MLKLVRYNSSETNAWNRHISTSHNGTFLLDRNYMDYHADRFDDHSLMFYLEDQLIATLPATEHGKEIRSHGGLTYGGIIFDHRMSSELMLRCFYELCKYFNNSGFESMSYKAIPYIYHIRPAQEDLYSIFRCQGTISARNPSSVINLHNTDMPGKKQNGAKKGHRMGLTVRKVNEPGNLLLEIDKNLRLRHGVQAVHSSTEMHYLTKLFPNNIDILEVINSSNNELVGGAIVYISAQVAHTQYLVVNDIGRPLRAMDVLIMDIIERYKKRCRYLDFGISSEESGWLLNTSLISQKEGFRASTACYDIYQIQFHEALLKLNQSRDIRFE